MSALITEAFPLIFSSAAHNFTARGDPATRRGYSASAPKAEAAARGRKCTGNARVHLFGRRVHFAAAAGWRQDETARLCPINCGRYSYFEIDTDIVWDAVQRDMPALKPAVERLLKELGYGE